MVFRGTIESSQGVVRIISDQASTAHESYPALDSVWQKLAVLYQGEEPGSDPASECLKLIIARNPGAQTGSHDEINDLLVKNENATDKAKTRKVHFRSHMTLLT